MSLPEALSFDPTLLRRRIEQLVADLPAPDEDVPADKSPAMVGAALVQSIEVIARAETDGLGSGAGRLGPADVERIGDYALSLIESLAWLSGRARRSETAVQIQSLAMPLALWVARRGGRIAHLEVVVNAFAQYANGLRAPRALGELSDAMGEVLAAAADSHKQDLEKSNPMRPWRVLNLNRAIVATRSHDPARMEVAFDAMVASLPEDARAFFHEGMQQMDIVGYPDHVRAIMSRYRDKWGSGDTLH